MHQCRKFGRALLPHLWKDKAKGNSPLEWKVTPIYNRRSCPFCQIGLVAKLIFLKLFLNSNIYNLLLMAKHLVSRGAACSHLYPLNRKQIDPLSLFSLPFASCLGNRGESVLRRTRLSLSSPLLYLFSFS